MPRRRRKIAVVDRVVTRPKKAHRKDQKVLLLVQTQTRTSDDTRCAKSVDSVKSVEFARCELTETLDRDNKSTYILSSSRWLFSKQDVERVQKETTFTAVNLDEAIQHAMITLHSRRDEQDQVQGVLYEMTKDSLVRRWYVDGTCPCTSCQQSKTERVNHHVKTGIDGNICLFHGSVPDMYRRTSMFAYQTCPVPNCKGGLSRFCGMIGWHFDDNLCDKHWWHECERCNIWWYCTGPSGGESCPARCTRIDTDVHVFCSDTLYDDLL
jgi:hypothetical protein